MKMEIDKRNGNCGIYMISNSMFFYIGQSTNIKKRWSYHKSKMKKGKHSNVLIQRVYDKYKELDPFIFEVIKTCNQSELNSFETYYEEFYNSSNKIKMNIAKTGSSGWNDVQRRIQSDKIKGRKYSKEHRQKISKGQLGNTRPNQKVSIIQLTLSGEFIKEWNSIKEASSQLQIKINMNRKQSGGYIWIYKSNYKQGAIKEYKLNNTKAICQFSLDNILLNEFDSIAIAVRKTGINRNAITSVLLNKQKTGGGYIWKYRN